MSNDIIADNHDDFKLKNLIKKSEKSISFAKEKNQIELKRLEFLKRILDRARQQNDLKLREKCMEIKYLSDKLHETTNDTQKESRYNRKKPKIFTWESKSSIIFERNKNYFLRKDLNNSQNEVSKSYINWDALRSFYCKSSQSCRYFKDDEQSSNLCDRSMVASRCSFFPCSPLSTYTSIVGPKNDKRIKTAHSKLTYEEKSKKDDDYDNEVIECGEGITEEEIEKLVNKSKRAPYSKIDPMRNLRFKIKALEKHSEMTIKQNHEKYTVHDRNVRYGGELPKTPLYRQLRIISANEALENKKQKKLSSVS